MNEKVYIRINIAVAVLLALSLGGNIVQWNIQHAGHAGSTGEGVESSIADAKSADSAAKGAVELGKDGVERSIGAIDDSDRTVDSISDSVEQNIGTSGDAISTIRSLRGQIQDIEGRINRVGDDGGGDDGIPDNKDNSVTGK